MSSQPQSEESIWDSETQDDNRSITSTVHSETRPKSALQDGSLSLFESIITSYPPILESLLSQLPTTSIFDLYHTSKHLQAFLRQYPLAWKTLSFRLPQPTLVLGSPGNETPDGRERQSKAYALDALLKEVVLPYGRILRSLDLCNTAVSGIALVGSVLSPRINTLEHLSVRGCKNVSIKYHVVPFLEPYTQKGPPWIKKDLALKSLYTYRCRHHRRRPYLPSSLVRRDSDSDPTHQLIEICHELGIWTDTAWCPTPGGRCFRRKDYHSGRAGPGNMEVWVPFDRLWRSGNRIGPGDTDSVIPPADGRLWEISETGHDGEPLGTGSGVFKGEGKHIPAHLRHSHKFFVENVKCTQCNDVILERCESCSVRMHCMGCRKTLCASCAFNRPIPRKRPKTRHFTSLAFGNVMAMGSTFAAPSATAEDQTRNAQEPKSNRFWWAPGASRSPNLMNEIANDDDSSDSEDGNVNGAPPPPSTPPKLNMHWCCLEPIFSGGGGIAVLGTGLGGRGADKIRAAPLPRSKQYEDPDFSSQLRPVDYVRELKNNGLYEYVLGEDIEILSYLKQDSLDLQASTCPRGLCQDCFRSFRWKVSCRGCKKPLCKEHDFRGLKVRKCGYRDLHHEREYVRTHNEPQRLVIPAFKPNAGKALEGIASRPKTLEYSPAEGSSRLLPPTDIERPESTPPSQSQIIVPVHAAPTAVDMSASVSQTSHDSTVQSSALSNLNPTTSFAPPPASSRPRSLSVSGLRSRNSSTWQNPRQVNPITNPLPLPCSPRHPVQWEGCGAYFCPLTRPVGDSRPRCMTSMKECGSCNVLVCETCASTQPYCICTFCSTHFHCPPCTRKKEVKARCRFQDELKQKQEAEVRAREKAEREKVSREQADMLAESVWEFWEGLVGDVMDEITNAGINADVATEPTLGGPSSHGGQPTSSDHTETTLEPFEAEAAGMALPQAHEEPMNFPHGSDTDHPITTEDIASIHHSNTIQPVHISSEDEEVDDLDSDDIDIDIDEEDEGADDDLDAEGALIDEFIDEGALIGASA